MAQRKPQNLTDDELFDDWVAWADRVKDELVGLAWNRRVYREVSKVFQHNQHLQEVGGFVYEWLQLNYVAAATMSFRREVDRARHMGFVHLLSEIAERPTVLSRHRYYDLWGPPQHDVDAAMRSRAFESIDLVRYADDPMRDHLDPASVRRDIDALRLDTELAQNYVEQAIAHRTRGEPQSITFEQFYEAIDALEPMFAKYYARLTLNSMVQLEPTAQFNMYEPFTFPWDVTCDRLWEAGRAGQRLPWDQIKEVYRDDGNEEK